MAGAAAPSVDIMQRLRDALVARDKATAEREQRAAALAAAATRRSPSRSTASASSPGASRPFSASASSFVPAGSSRPSSRQSSPSPSPSTPMAAFFRAPSVPLRDGGVLAVSSDSTRSLFGPSGDIRDYAQYFVAICGDNDVSRASSNRLFSLWVDTGNFSQSLLSYSSFLTLPAEVRALLQPTQTSRLADYAGRSADDPPVGDITLPFVIYTVMNDISEYWRLDLTLTVVKLATPDGKFHLTSTACVDVLLNLPHDASGPCAVIADRRRHARDCVVVIPRGLFLPSTDEEIVLAGWDEDDDDDFWLARSMPYLHGPAGGRDQSDGASAASLSDHLRAYALSGVAASHSDSVVWQSRPHPEAFPLLPRGSDDDDFVPVVTASASPLPDFAEAAAAASSSPRTVGLVAVPARMVRSTRTRPVLRPRELRLRRAAERTRALLEPFGRARSDSLPDPPPPIDLLFDGAAAAAPLPTVYEHSPLMSYVSIRPSASSIPPKAPLHLMVGVIAAPADGPDSASDTPVNEVDAPSPVAVPSASVSHGISALNLPEGYKAPPPELPVGATDAQRSEYIRGHLPPTLSPSLSDKLHSLLMKFPKLFTALDKSVTPMKTVDVPMKPDAVPKKLKARKVPAHLLPFLQKEINKLVAQGVLRKIDTGNPTDRSPWASPLLTTAKRSGGIRMCCDLSYLNQHVLLEPMDFPLVEDLLHQTSGYDFFSCIDLISGFFQLGVTEEAQKTLRLATPFGEFAFLRLPMGLTSSPREFQTLLDSIFNDLQVQYLVSVYLDDILVKTMGNEDQHLALLEEVLSRLDRNGLHVNLAKSMFCSRQVEYLGNIVSKHKRSVAPARLSGLLNMAPPSNLKECEMAVGMMQYYTAFSDHLAIALAPINDYIATTRAAQRERRRVAAPGPPVLAAFSAARDIVLSPTVLMQPDPARPFFIHSDASLVGAGAVVMQSDDDGRLRPTAFVSHKFNKVQRGWSTTDREMFALVMPFRRFPKLLRYSQVFAFSDHSDLAAWHASASPKVRRYAAYLNTFNVRLGFIPGKLNVVSDAISRLQPSSPDNVIRVNLVHPSSDEDPQAPFNDPVSIAEVAGELGVPLTSPDDFVDSLARLVISTSGCLASYPSSSVSPCNLVSDILSPEDLDEELSDVASEFLPASLDFLRRLASAQLDDAASAELARARAAGYASKQVRNGVCHCGTSALLDNCGYQRLRRRCAPNYSLWHMTNVATRVRVVLSSVYARPALRGRVCRATLRLTSSRVRRVYSQRRILIVSNMARWATCSRRRGRRVLFLLPTS